MNSEYQIPPPPISRPSCMCTIVILKTVNWLRDFFKHRLLSMKLSIFINIKIQANDTFFLLRTAEQHLSRS